MTTFGTLPGDVVTNSRGDVQLGVVLSLYATAADAAVPTGLLATVTTDAEGRWSYTDASRGVVWVRTSVGRVYATLAPDALPGTTDASGLTTGTLADARLPVTAQAATLSSTYAPVVTVEIAVATTANLTIDCAHGCTVTSAYTVTLPTPVGATGRQIRVRVTPGSTNLLTLATAAGNIDGQATRIMWAAESATLMSDGTNWVKIAGKTIPMVCVLRMAAAQAIPTTTNVVATLDTTTTDNTGQMATLASHAITIKRPSRYLILAKTAVDAATSDMRRLISMALLNATTVIVQQEISALATAYPVMTALDEKTLAAADMVQLQALQICATPATRNFAVGSIAYSTSLTVREIPSW